MTSESRDALSPIEFHVLLAVTEGPQYGYAIRNAVEEESEGALLPRAGTLYRVLARLMTNGLVREEDPPVGGAPHPGLTRKYYGLTEAGRTALATQTLRLRKAAGLAEQRLGLTERLP